MNILGASEELISEIANIIPLDRVVIAAVDTETGTFRPDFFEFLYDSRLMVLDNNGKSYEGSITADVVKHGTGQIIDIDDPRLTSGQLPWVQATFDRGYRTMMAVPLVFEEKIIGSLILLSSREKEYTDQDLSNADRVGKILSGALARYSSQGSSRSRPSSLP